MAEKRILTKEQVEIFGRPNFACTKMANILILGGLYDESQERNKAEYEQAVWIHWASSLYQEHGEKWWDVGVDVLNECANKINRGG